MRLLKILPPQVSVNQSVKTMEGFSIFPRAPELETHHQSEFSAITWTSVRWTSAEMKSAYYTARTDMVISIL